MSFISKSCALAFRIHMPISHTHTQKRIKIRNFSMGRFFLLITNNPIVCIYIIYFIINLLVIYISYCDYHIPTSTIGSLTESSQRDKNKI